jgi:feruloyl-CoA synthase
MTNTTSFPFRQIHLGPVDIERRELEDGAILLRSKVPLEPYPTRLTERLLHWAEQAPERVFMAQRNSAGAWQTLTYATVLNNVRNLAQALLNRNLNTERTVAILCENSLRHALLALAAMHVGIPYTAISTAYSLVSTDFGKLKHTLALMTPGLVLVSDGDKYNRAVRAAVPANCEVVVSKNPFQDRPSTLFSDLLNTKSTPAVEAAFARLEPDTVAKILFTSGSTGQPKGVINTQQMLCANLQQITQTFPFMLEEPPVFVDWLPWNHTFGGNHNLVLTLYNGGSLYIDDGRPVANGIRC